jgi:hypothetical protein
MAKIEHSRHQIMFNPIPGIIYFVLMYQMPNQPPLYDFVEVPTAEECAILVKEAILMANEKLSGAKIEGRCVTVFPQTWEIKDTQEQEDSD